MGVEGEEILVQESLFPETPADEETVAAPPQVLAAAPSPSSNTLAKFMTYCGFISLCLDVFFVVTMFPTLVYGDGPACELVVGHTDRACWDDMPPGSFVLAYFLNIWTAVSDTAVYLYQAVGFVLCVPIAGAKACAGQ